MEKDQVIAGEIRGLLHKNLLDLGGNATPLTTFLYRIKVAPICGDAHQCRIRWPILSTIPVSLTSSLMYFYSSQFPPPSPVIRVYRRPRRGTHSHTPRLQATKSRQ